MRGIGLGLGLPVAVERSRRGCELGVHKPGLAVCQVRILGLVRAELGLRESFEGEVRVRMFR